MSEAVPENQAPKQQQGERTFLPRLDDSTPISPTVGPYSHRFPGSRLEQQPIKKLHLKNKILLTADQLGQKADQTQFIPPKIHSQKCLQKFLFWDG